MTPAEAAEVIDDEAVDTEVLENEPVLSDDAPATDAAPEQVTPSTVIRDQLIAAGIHVEADSDEAAFGQIAQQQQYLLQQHRQLEQAQYELSEFRRQQQQQLVQQQHFAQQQYAQRPPTPAPWSPPQLSEHSRRFMGPDGQPIESAPVSARSEIEAFNTYRMNFVEKFTNNPGEALAPFIQQQAAAIAEQAVNQRFQQIQAETFQRTYLAENADWAYEKGPDGRPLFNQITGQGVPSAYGRRLGEILQDIAVKVPGIQDRVALEMGERMLTLEINAQHGQQQYAQTQAVDTRQQFLKNAAVRTPNRSGSIPKTNDAPAQNGLLNLRQMLMQDLKEAGMSGF